MASLTDDNGIENPYCVFPSTFDKSYNVAFRYMLNGKIKYKIIAKCADKTDANTIAKLLNKNLVK